MARHDELIIEGVEESIGDVDDDDDVVGERKKMKNCM